MNRNTKHRHFTLLLENCLVIKNKTLNLPLKQYILCVHLNFCESAKNHEKQLFSVCLTVKLKSIVDCCCCENGKINAPFYYSNNEDVFTTELFFFCLQYKICGIESRVAQ